MESKPYDIRDRGFCGMIMQMKYVMTMKTGERKSLIARRKNI